MRSRPSTGRPYDAEGSAVLLVMLTLFLFSAIALTASTLVQVEVSAADLHRRSAEALYAAEGVLAVVVAELRTLTDWTPVLAGARQSAFTEGVFVGSRSLPTGRILLCCGVGSVAGRLAEETRLSPLPARRALPWRPFLWTRYDTLVGSARGTSLFVISFVQDDEADGDADGNADANAILVVRAMALEANGLQRSVEALVTRKSLGGRAAVQILRRREVR